jgi:prepilin-type N-terminal cleavage/methylation domain-containing protein
MLKKKLRWEKGFSLIELMVTIAILGIFAVLLAGIFREGTLSSRHAIEDSSLNVTFRMKTDGIRDDIRASKSGTINGTTYPAFNNGTKTLTLFTGTSTSPATMQYYLSNNILYRKPAGGAATEYLTDVSVFNVTMSGSAVNVTLQVSKTSPDFSKRAYKRSITIKAKPRVQIS